MTERWRSLCSRWSGSWYPHALWIILAMRLWNSSIRPDASPCFTNPQTFPPCCLKSLASRLKGGGSAGQCHGAPVRQRAHRPSRPPAGKEPSKRLLEDVCGADVPVGRKQAAGHRRCRPMARSRRAQWARQRVQTTNLPNRHWHPRLAVSRVRDSVTPSGEFEPLNRRRPETTTKCRGLFAHPQHDSSFPM
jgi:hypothetical protein